MIPAGEAIKEFVLTEDIHWVLIVEKEVGLHFAHYISTMMSRHAFRQYSRLYAG